MIDLSQEQLVALLVRSLICGAFLGAIYDCIRALKMFCGVSYGGDMVSLSLAKKALIWTVTFITDLIFWMIAGLLSVALMYQIGGGIFRGLTYICLTVGFAAYYFTLGRLVLKLNRIIVSFIKNVLKKLITLLMRPANMVWRGLIFLYHLTIGRIIGKIKDKWSASQSKKYDETLVLPDTIERKEDLVCVDERTGYRKSGRVSFGGKKSQ